MKRTQQDSQARMPATGRAGKHAEPVDLAEESVAGEEDPGASLGDPATRRTLQSETNSPGGDGGRRGRDSVEQADESGRTDRNVETGAPGERRAERD